MGMETILAREDVPEGLHKLYNRVVKRSDFPWDPEVTQTYV